MAVTRSQENGSNGGDRPVKKRHMITSSSVDGRLITTIKAAGALDISEVTDSESEDESTSLSSMDEEAMNHHASAWLKRDTPDSPSVYGECKRHLFICLHQSHNYPSQLANLFLFLIFKDSTLFPNCS